MRENYDIIRNRVRDCVYYNWGMCKKKGLVFRQARMFNNKLKCRKNEKLVFRFKFFIFI